MRLFLVLLLAFGTYAAQQSPPIPDPAELKRRALESLAKSEKDLENYSCIAHSEEDELNSDGSLKHRKSDKQEQFYVNGVEIDHTLERDGKPLSASEAKKEQQRVDKEVKKYSDPAQAAKSHRQDEKEADLLLRALRFTNGRREIEDGRPTIIYDMSGDPNFHPHKVEERFAKAVTGRIWVDEETGNPRELKFETTKDVKIGGGLLANVHKGFRLELRQQRQPDGVWIATLVEGRGDVRAALFLHPRFAFKQELQGCHRFSVNTEQKISNPAAQQNLP